MHYWQKCAVCPNTLKKKKVTLKPIFVHSAAGVLYAYICWRFLLRCRPARSQLVTQVTLCTVWRYRIFKKPWLLLHKKILQKMPPLLICDDACTFVSHSLQRYPVTSELAYGEKRGCFEKPSEHNPPQKDISCPEILPIELSSREVNREAMNNLSSLIHPDVSTSTRYVSGTR